MHALEYGKLELPIAFLVVQEMVTHWPEIFAYISSTNQRREFHHVEGRVWLFLQVSPCR